MVRKLCIAVIILHLAVVVLAQNTIYQPNPDSPFGERNPAAPNGTQQYDFLIGDWDVDVTLYRDGQDPLVYVAKWHNHWVANGFVVMQEWRGPYSTGIEMRSYDADRNIWHGRNFYVPEPGNWYENSAEFMDSNMVVTTYRSASEGGESITREIYSDISDASFSIRTERSVDGGLSWVRGRYSATAYRANSRP